MTPEFVLTIGRQALEVTLALVSVLLIPALAVGLLISTFQAATQISEATLSFIPKLMITFAALLMAGPWMLQLLTTYTQRLYEAIPTMIGL